MKRFFSIILFPIILILGITLNVVAGAQDFTLINETGFDLYELYISPNISDDWEEDILEDGILLNGESIEITFDYGDVAIWDILVVDEKGNEFYWEEFNLNEICAIRLYYEDDQVWAEWE